MRRVPFLPRVYAAWLLRRSLVIWAAMRGVLLLLVLLLGSPVRAPTPSLLLASSLRTHVVLIALATGLTLLDTWRRNELLLFANAGVPAPLTAATIALVPCALELTLGLAL